MNVNYKFSCIFENKTLKGALGIFQNILEKKSSDDALTSTKIIIKDGVAVFTGVNSSIIGIRECPVIVEMPGEIIINAHIFYDVVKKINNQEIKISQEYDTNIITVTAGKSIFKIPVQIKDEFPDINLDNFDTKCVIKNKELSFIIDSILFTASSDDVRHYLCGLKFIKDGLNIEAAATDGHRLAISKGSCIETDEDDLISITIPRKTTQEVSRLIKDNTEGEVVIKFSVQKIGFFMDHGKTIIVSKLVHGNFPDYNAIINEEHNLQLVINTKNLIEVIERCIIILDEKNTKAMCINIEEHQIVLTAQSDNRGYIYETIDDCSIEYDNEENRCKSIMINAYYLHEIAKNIKSERIILDIKENIRPVLVREEGNDRKSYYLMPMASK